MDHGCSFIFAVLFFDKMLSLSNVIKKSDISIHFMFAISKIVAISFLKLSNWSPFQNLHKVPQRIKTLLHVMHSDNQYPGTRICSMHTVALKMREIAQNGSLSKRCYVTNRHLPGSANRWWAWHPFLDEAFGKGKVQWQHKALYSVVAH